MGAVTKIEWCDRTFNPWWGCEHVPGSRACDHCYAEAFAKRTGHRVWGRHTGRRFFGDAHWTEPLRWERDAAELGRPLLVFCASMADVFEDRRDLDDQRARLWRLIEDTPHLIWLLLTKRPAQVRLHVPGRWLAESTRSVTFPPLDPDRSGPTCDAGWPPNVWVGTTVEDQARADERVPALLRIPATVRFLSCEPLLGPVDLDGLWGYPGSADSHQLERWPIHWVIVGESGPRHRPLNLDHARDLRRQCERAGVPFFFKQVGGLHPTSGGDVLDGKVHKVWPAAAGERGQVVSVRGDR